MLKLVSRNGTDSTPAVSLDQMAQHLKREDTVEDDDYINACLLAATEYAEMFTGIVMIDSTYDLFVNDFPAGSNLGLPRSSTIYLRRAPLLEVVSVTYRNSGGASTVLGTGGYSVDFAGSSIYLPLSSSWPSTDGAANAVTIRFRVGYVDYSTYPPSVGDIPETFKAAIKLYAAELYGNRDNERLVDNSSRVPYGAEMLLRLHRIDDSLA